MVKFGRLVGFGNRCNKYLKFGLLLWIVAQNIGMVISGVKIGISITNQWFERGQSYEDDLNISLLMHRILRLNIREVFARGCLGTTPNYINAVINAIG